MTDAQIDPLQRTILALVNGQSPDALADQHAAYGLSRSAMLRMIRRAQDQIARATDYDRRRELALAYRRLRDLYRRSVAVQDCKTALAAQRELNRLLDLYPQDATPDDQPTDDPDARLAREHLAAALTSLGHPNQQLDQLPLSELARLAAAAIASR